MDTKELAEKINALPPSKQEEIAKMLNEIASGVSQPGISKDRTPGFAKGIIEILPGFDDPIEGMEEYM